MVRAALQDLHAVDVDNVVNSRAHEALIALDIVNNAPASTPANGAVYPTSGRVATSVACSPRWPD